jgi:hypothetical protein
MRHRISVALKDDWRGAEAPSFDEAVAAFEHGTPVCFLPSEILLLGVLGELTRPGLGRITYTRTDD